uniref:Uncharacterized protein n=1 Tax=Arundo donax TaxID=35708 RepID=A0A0A8YLF3_ARUDO
MLDKLNIEMEKINSSLLQVHQIGKFIHHERMQHMSF